MLYNPLLDTFVCVAEAGSFNKAAEELFISSPAVIKQVNSLEQEMKLRLFVRTHRGLTLTEAGKSLYKDALYMRKYSAEALDRARARARQEGPHIRIGTSLMTPVDILLELWPRIYEQIPDVKFQVVPFDNTPENAREILRNLGERIDIIAGVFDGGMLAYHPYCRTIEIADVPVCGAVSLDHPLARKERLCWSDLAGETLYMIKPGWSTTMDALRQTIERDYPDIHIQTFDFYNAQVFNACENGHAVLIAFPFWKAVHPLLKIISIDEAGSMPYCIVHSPKPNGTTQRFLDAVTHIVKTPV